MRNIYEGDTFKIEMTRYSDPERLNMAHSAAIYLHKPDTNNTKRPLRIIRDGHVPAILRGEMAEFVFHGVSKEVYDHLVTYSTMNMRVAGGFRANVAEGYTMPSDKTKLPSLVEHILKENYNNYLTLAHSETPQVARAAAPINVKMPPFKMQFNLLTLAQSVFPQRIWDKGAQGNTVKVVEGMYRLVYEQDPELWATIYTYMGEPMTNWKHAYRKMVKQNVSLRDLKKALQEYEGHDDEYAIYVISNIYGKAGSMWE